MAGANDAFEEGVDVTAGGTGLFVVGRLAARHGLRVQLRPHHEVGTVASVLLPEDVLVVPPPALSLLSGKLAARAAKPWGAPVRTGDEVTDEVSDERAEEPVEEPADVLEVEPQPPVALSVVRDPEPVADSEPDVRADDSADDRADDSEPRDLKTLLAPSHPRHRLGVPAQHEPAAPQPGRRVALGGSTPAIGDAPAVEGRRIRRS
jgi:hypothetical protein